jgi:ATP-binding cassette, subfamily B (MDR/TAP), member 1
VDDFPALQHAGNRNALWFFIVALVSTYTAGAQTYFFSYAAASVTSNLRVLSFKAMVRQDSTFLFSSV